MALGFGAIFADYHAENKEASMGPGAVFYFFCAIAYMLLVLFTGVSPVYRLVRSSLRQSGLPLLDALMVSGWVLAAILISILVVILVSRRGIKALTP